MSRLPRARVLTYSPAIRDSLNRAMDAVEAIEALAWPLSRTGTEGGTASFESREPGHVVCPWAVERVESILADAARRLDAVYAKAKVRDSEPPAESVAGVEISAGPIRGDWTDVRDGKTLDDEPLAAIRNRRDGKTGRFAVGATRSHLDAKLRRMVE